mmetsp:Transcript_15683/g.49091  ORF Transcript_15683/g.49091 Transcript_15683/m.49091 type:complete len:302 (+) Transcript_15683:367-1272(+)
MQRQFHVVGSVSQPSSGFFMYRQSEATALREEWRMPGAAVGVLPSHVSSAARGTLPLLLTELELRVLLLHGAITIVSEQDFVAAALGVRSLSDEEVAEDARWASQLASDLSTIRSALAKEFHTARDAPARTHLTLAEACAVLGVDPNDREKRAARACSWLLQVSEDDGPVGYGPIDWSAVPGTSALGDRAGPLGYEDPATPGVAQRTRAALAYVHLWNKGFTVARASKFGGDFLLYDGDPLAVHARYLVLVFGPQDPFGPLDVVSFGRLGQAVRKTTLVLVVDVAAGSVDRCLTIRWRPHV